VEAGLANLPLAAWATTAPNVLNLPFGTLGMNGEAQVVRSEGRVLSLRLCRRRRR
jgi:hypothetical protein